MQGIAPSSCRQQHTELRSLTFTRRRCSILLSFTATPPCSCWGCLLGTRGVPPRRPALLRAVNGLRAPPGGRKPLCACRGTVRWPAVETLVCCAARDCRFQPANHRAVCWQGTTWVAARQAACAHVPCWDMLSTASARPVAAVSAWASMQQGRALDQLQAQWTKPGRRPHWPAPTSASSAMASAASAQSSSVSPACTLGPASDAKGTATQPSPAAVSARAAAVEAGPLRLRCFRAWAPPGP